jgi:hypothetical protein
MARIVGIFGMGVKRMLQFYDSPVPEEVHSSFLPGERTHTMQHEKTANEWFFTAEHSYASHHQGCGWCGDTHCVRRERHGAKHVYACQRCDFQVSYDAERDSFHVIPGEDLRSGTETMLEQPIANLF